MALPVDDTRRYDLYLCAASSGAIAPVASSSSARRSSIDAGDLASAVFDSLQKRARDSGRTASVFYAPRCVQGSYDEGVDAVLQTRGGGTALVVFSKPFLQEDRCVGELLQFLTMDASAQPEEKAHFRFACVGVTPAEILQDPRIEPYASALDWHRMHTTTSTTLSAAKFEIVKLGWDAWLFPSSPNVLGATVRDSLLDLQCRVFPEIDAPLAKSVFGVEDPNAITLADVFSVALSTYKIGSEYDGSILLDKLVTAGSGLLSAEKRAAIAAFKRKWSLAVAWDWSCDARDCLKNIPPPGVPPDPVDNVPAPCAPTQPPMIAPRNPDGVVLDFSNATSVEGRLKNALLGAPSSSEAVAAVSLSSSSGVAAACGMGGVGKTCALRGLCQLKDVWSRFPNGIFFVTLGQDATVTGVISSLANVFEELGKIAHSERIRGCESVKAAVDAAGRALSGLRCLLLLDDLWPTPWCEFGYLDDLLHLADSCDSLRIVFSTRSRAIARRAGKHTVSFGSRDEVTSKRMLLSYAGVTELETGAMIGDAAEALEYALGACCGVPISLAATGRLVGWYLEHLEDKSNKPLAWCQYKLDLSEDYVLCAGDDHPGLSAAFLQSLRVVDSCLRGDDQEHKHPAAEMYRALCVLQKQSWAPFSMLAALWSAGANSGVVELVCQEFEVLSMLEIEMREIDGSLVGGIRLHDLAHDFCTSQAAKHDESAGRWDASLLNGYLQHEQPAWDVPRWLRVPFELLALLPKDSASQPRPWWSVTNDGYIYMHVIRHLLACHEIAEATGLLLDFRYILAQVEHSGLIFLAQDLAHLLAYLRGADGPQNDEAWCSKIQALELLTNAIGYSWSGIVGDARALSRRLAFQILGRMNQFMAENSNVERLLHTVGQYEPAPFLRPLLLTLPMSNPGLRISLDMSKWVIAVAWIPRTNRVIVATMRSKVLFVVDVSTGQTVRELNGHEDFVSCVTSFASGSTAGVVSGGEDGTVRFWSAETGQETEHYIQAAKDKVVAMAASTDGVFVVSVSRNGAVQRWKTTTREEVGRLVASAPESLGYVRSVAVSSNGRRVVAGTRKGEVWLWNLEGVKVGMTVTGVKLGAHRSSLNFVHAIAMTADGEKVVSAGFDRAIRVWDVRQQRADGDPIEIDDDNFVCSLSVSHDGDKIYCGLSSSDIHLYDERSRRRVKLLRHAHTSPVKALEASADGRQLVSGGGDGRVRLWDLAASSEWAGSGERPASTGGCTGVECIAASTDGRWMVTGHDDNSDCAVQLWDAATGEADGSALCGHTRAVLCVAVSPDSRRVVSCSFDETVRVWGVDSREEVLGPLRTHSGAVSSVAISADGSRIVSGSGDGTLHVWAMATGVDLFGPLAGHKDWVDSVAASPDGRLIASGSFDCDVRLWDMGTGAPVGEPLQGHSRRVRSVAFSADSQHLVSRDQDGDVRVWSVATRECVRALKRGDPLYHSSVDNVTATGLRHLTPSSSTLLSMFHSARSKYVYRGDPADRADENIVAVFDLEVAPKKWHFDSERQRLWVVFGDRTLGIADFK